MRSLSQIKQSIVDDILTLRSDVRMAEGDSQYDVVVNSPAQQFYRYEVLLELEDRTKNLGEFQDIINDESFKQEISEVLAFKQDGSAYTVSDVNTLISERLDAYVQDWTSRLPGSKASGVVRVFLSDSSVVSWDNSTIFTSKNGSTYEPTSVVTDVIPNFDSTSGLYYVDIAVEATSVGTSANASANSITAMDPKPSTFSYCRNPAAVGGGSEEETDLDLINRVSEIKVRTTNGSKASYETLAESTDYVDDARAFDEDNPEEGLYLGSVCDVFTQFSNEDSELVEQIVYWPGLESSDTSQTHDFILNHQPPLTDVTPIVFKYTTAGVEEQIVSDTDSSSSSYAEISFIEDSGTYSGSVKANNKLRLSLKLNTDNYQRKLKILYVYDKYSEKLQEVFNSEDNRMVGPEILVRKAEEVPIRVIVEPTIAFGYVEADVQSAIESNIAIFFNGGTTSFGRQYERKEIGDDIQHTDIGTVILRTEGVSSYDSDTFFVTNTITGSTSDPISIKDFEYGSLHDVVFDYSTFALSNFTASFS